MRVSGAVWQSGRPWAFDRLRAFDREATLAQAMRLFWVKGYEATSIADLTEAMGVGPTSLYAAFGSEDELYAEVIRLYSATYEDPVLGRFCKATTAREAVVAYLRDSATAVPGSDCDLPRECLVTLGTVGSDGHSELRDLTRAARSSAFELLRARFEEAALQGELPRSVDVIEFARFAQTVQGGMAIRARDGADRAELEVVTDIAMAGWDGIVSRAQ